MVPLSSQVTLNINLTPLPALTQVALCCHYSGQRLLLSLSSVSVV